MARRDTPTQRTDRQVSWLISLGGVALVVGHALRTASRDDGYALWWNVLGGLLVLLVVTFAVAGPVLPFRALRLGWITAPVASALLLLTSFAAHEDPAAAGALPWVWSFEAALVSYLVLVLRPALATVATVASALLPALSALLVVGHVPGAVATATPIHVANIVYVAIFTGIRGRLNRLRAAETRALDEEARRARALVEAAEHERVARLVHDEVLSVLTAAMAFRGAPPPALRAEAGRALAMLTGAADPAGTALPDDPVDTAVAAAVLRERLGRIDPDCPLRADVTPGRVPGAAVEVVGAAAAEALRNSVRHAGRAARAVDIRVAPDILEVAVRDAGPGFDPATVPTGALGLEGSIKRRMAGLAGGSAEVETSPGAGTRVRLTWRT